MHYSRMCAARISDHHRGEMVGVHPLCSYSTSLATPLSTYTHTHTHRPHTLNFIYAPLPKFTLEYTSPPPHPSHAVHAGIHITCQTACPDTHPMDGTTVVSENIALHQTSLAGGNEEVANLLLDHIF